MEEPREGSNHRNVRLGGEVEMEVVEGGAGAGTELVLAPHHTITSSADPLECWSGPTAVLGLELLVCCMSMSRNNMGCWLERVEVVEGVEQKRCSSSH